MKELVDDALNKLSDNNLSKEQKAGFIESVALENVDIKALGLYTLGELRKSSNKGYYKLSKIIRKIFFEDPYIKINRLLK